MTHLIATLFLGTFACLLSFFIGKRSFTLLPNYRRYLKWKANGMPGVVTLEEAQQFKAWKELNKPVTGSGANLYRAIVADREHLKARIDELENKTIGLLPMRHDRSFHLL